MQGICSCVDCGQGLLDKIIAVCQVALVCCRDDRFEGSEILEEGGHGREA